MDADDAELRSILASFAREEGRSAYAVIDTPRGTWSGGVSEDEVVPAASLLKLAIGMALEARLEGAAPERVGDLLRDSDASVLHALDSDHLLAPRELLALMLSASDAPAARWATGQVGIEGVKEAAMNSGAVRTRVIPDDEFGVLGETSAREAIHLLRAAADPARFPACAAALHHSILNSRIPLGVTGDDIAMAHKTGTFTGVAHDVAHLECRGGDVWIAFLSVDQHDTLVTGYDMGLCTRALLECADLQVRRTRSVTAPF